MAFATKLLVFQTSKRRKAKPLKFFFHEEEDNNSLHLGDTNITADVNDNAVPAIEPMLPLVVIHDNDDRPFVGDFSVVTRTSNNML